MKMTLLGATLVLLSSSVPLSWVDCLCASTFGNLTDPGGGGDPYVNLTFDPTVAGASSGTASVDTILLGLGRCFLLPECSLVAKDCRFDFTVTVSVAVDPLYPPSKVQFRDGSEATFNAQGVAVSGHIIVDDVECGDDRHFWLKVRNASNQVMGGADILLQCANCEV
jgi:hypothetical protein